MFSAVCMMVNHSKRRIMGGCFGVHQKNEWNKMFLKDYLFMNKYTEATSNRSHLQFAVIKLKMSLISPMSKTLWRIIWRILR